MKNLFLYEKTFINKSDIPKVNGVYDFELCPLVGIDTNIISKQKRNEIVKSARLRECFILQEWLINLVKFAKEFDVSLMKIELSVPIDEEVEKDINKGIITADYKKLSDYLLRIMAFFECDIKVLTFCLKAKMISITSSGVISIYDDSFDDIKDAAIWCVIAGYKNDFECEGKPLWDS